MYLLYNLRNGDINGRLHFRYKLSYTSAYPVRVLNNFSKTFSREHVKN